MIRSKVLIVGDGAREHALAARLSLSVHEPRISALVVHENPGIRRIVERSGGELVKSGLDPRGLVEAVNRVNPDLVVIGPEEPQFAGVADKAAELGIPTFGVPRSLAMIEQSKAFARALMWKYRIPGRIAFRAFRDINEALHYISSAGSVAIKPARQSGGKGVRVFWDRLAYLRDGVNEAKVSQVLAVSRDMAAYDDIDARIVVEEAVTGVEYTVQVISDGKSIIALPPIQDNPHVFDYDVGPECGGMGAIVGPGSSLPFLTQEEYEESVEITRKSLDALQRETGLRYVGVLGGQFMLTTYGPTLIEYYSRFGDPEVLNALAMLNDDLLEIMEATVDGRLSSIKYSFKRSAVAISKAVAPMGYPHNRDLARGRSITIDIDRIRKLGCEVYFGSVIEEDGLYKTLGSRAVEVLAVGNTYRETYEKIENCIAHIKSPDWQLIHRRDIGSRELIERRVKEAERVRAVYKWRRSHGLGRVRIDWVPGGEITVYDYT
ncbi:phosphoribosylamine--glycine ligase [Vulcanisaeta souniana]|uniref:phosphoribosylamine--glycine ligase n=1 Tax=Vulcanisaeta souniana JCM 11219 TaxID=1293586 RepID=A0A830EII4_9CREN|nr:phosphoribosylamine--glycine ligase [Vulcanisaeta souniana]BDR91000.1 phosphoribosylamine--glycine ligase [Vulcanisaeta souniana JCM 11219]GGI79908.1 phosphoribosylamine--glycine ligase [Vulcanisaeta souniana JCM 11219]